MTGVQTCVLPICRYVIDFGQRDQLQAAVYPEVFDWITDNVLPDRERKAKEGTDSDCNMRLHHKAFLSRWWQLSFPRIELTAQVNKLTRFIVCSRVTKRPVFVFISREIRPGDALSCFTFEDDYSFGILQSSAHWLWFITKCSKDRKSTRLNSSHPRLSRMPSSA